MKLSFSFPNVALINITSITIRYSSFRVVIFKFIKSIYTFNLLFFLNTDTMFYVYSTYLSGLINPAPMSNSIFFFT